MTQTSDLPNGYTMLPPGKLANAVTWLDLRKAQAKPLGEPLRLTAATDQDLDICRRLFAEVGTPWLWSRAFDSPDRVPANVFIASDDAGSPVGIIELSGRDGPAIEIAYFGLLPTATGRGLGRRLMAAALTLAWQTADRVWLHTCNFDHPGALRFYRSCGFVPYATGFEIMDDPRLEGRLPADAAPHVPLILPDGDRGRAAD